MAGKTLVYRGILKSCNYRCTYCPFSKHPMSGRELEKDREQWFDFVRTLVQGEAGDVEALLVAPYGEALIHPWYWEGLAQISALPHIRAVGAQTNLSFDVRRSVENIFDEVGGVREKLRFWATFHPEMTNTENFSRQCLEIVKMGAKLSAGVVGVPENLEILRELREKLPGKIYLWINKMDGLGRQYTEEEKEAFLVLDPYFLRELAVKPADGRQCEGRLFVEGGGKVRICNISRALSCSRKQCSCYLAYGDRRDLLNQALFGPYPIFRIPRRAKAVFLDLAGTLFPGKGEITEMALAGLKGLVRDKIPVFAATTLPYEEARKRCRGFWKYFSGGVFSGGAHLVLHADQEHGWDRRELFYYLEESCFAPVERMAEEYRCRVLTYEKEGRVYKITLLRPGHRPWSEEEREAVCERYRQIFSGEFRCFAEGHCLEIVSVKADKAGGVRTLCGWLGIAPEDTAAAGDSEEDVQMLKLCGGYGQSSCRQDGN